MARNLERADHPQHVRGLVVVEASVRYTLLSHSSFTHLQSIARFSLKRDGQAEATKQSLPGVLPKTLTDVLRGLGIPGIPLLVREPSADGGAVKQATVDDGNWSDEDAPHAYHRRQLQPPVTPANSPVPLPVSPPALPVPNPPNVTGIPDTITANLPTVVGTVPVIAGSMASGGLPPVPVDAASVAGTITTTAGSGAYHLALECIIS